MQHMGAKLSHMEESVLKADSDGGGDQGDDLGSEATRELQLGLIENEDEILSQVRDALDRIKRKIFGKCGACSDWIPPRRLEVLPYAKYCVGCQTKAENGELDD